MKTGDKVVCINSNWFGLDEIPNPIKGEIYSILGVVEPRWLELVGFTGMLYDIHCFRPVDDTFGEVVAEIIEKQVEVEEMETV